MYDHGDCSTLGAFGEGACGSGSYGDRFRFRKRYAVPSSPLLLRRFWRVVIDEAQAVQTKTATPSQLGAMAMRIQAEMRWCVTGTPLSPERGLIDGYDLLRFLGAELIEVEDELCPLFPSEGARGVVKSMVESAAYDGRYVSPNQYESELNVEAHYLTTGPEIWKQTGGKIDYFFAGVGTGGTISGVGCFLKEQNPDIRIIAVEPATRHHSLSGLKRITGLPDEHFPSILDRDLLDDVVSVTDEEAYKAGIELARTDGVMAGPTTGAVLHATMKRVHSSVQIPTTHASLLLRKSAMTPSNVNMLPLPEESEKIRKYANKNLNTHIK